MQPTTSRYPHTWHAAETDQERAWLDQWARGHINPATLQPGTPTPEPALTVRSIR